MSEKEYIERGALIAFVREVRKKLPKDSKDFFTRDEMLLNFQQYLELQEAADVEPVVRGEWKESFTTRDCQCAPSGVSYTFWYTCSICGKKSRTKRERCLRCFSYMERSGSGE